MEAVGVGRRAVAVIIDAIPLFIVGYFIAQAAGQTTAEGFHLQGGPFFIWLGIAIVYYIVMEALWGATLGKLAMKLKVVKEGGEKLDWQASIVRNVMRLIDGFAIYLVAAIAVWSSKKRQRLGDMAAHTLVVSARAFIAFTMALAGGGLYATDSLAASPRYSDLVLSDAKGGPQKSTFKPDTAKIFLHSKLVDVPSGSKVKADWIAVKTKVAPPNYKIDSVELNVGALINQVDFNMSKPNAGWPEGDYKVALFIDGKPAGEVKFQVAK